ncbi:tRNA uridine-5-carboxymethylaminomethyl(34) synthesis GTPase MnmE [Parasphingorhabdus sp.]|uniref:tRNA uridine-5-carboxymethylaminomethyl(34) synthesis GTPase MnmE n=1 Tax=Parasphingorhabdus sp. TaxID=2709688 RepID=UPI0032635D17
MSADETIYALSSGQPPAAIAIIRISGTRAPDCLRALTGSLPEERRAALKEIRDPDSGELLDMALVLRFTGPETATGEDLVEIHCHGGRAVVQALETTLGRQKGLRKAVPGEFTRRAFANGRIDLAEAEGLSDLLFAETEWQRRSAIQSAGGLLSRRVEEWQARLLQLSAAVEAELDFSDEDDVVPTHLDRITDMTLALAQDVRKLLDRPRSEKLRDGVRIVLGGPPNSGKSTLLNALVDRQAAIVSDIAGTTRDVIEVPIAIEGIPFLFVDTAGIRDEGAEKIERIGVDLAKEQFALADLILWLGAEGQGPDSENLIEIGARADHPDHVPKSRDVLAISPVTGEGIDQLIAMLVDRAKHVIPHGSHISLNERQARHLKIVEEHLLAASTQSDFLIIAEELRLARVDLDGLTGRTSTEHMLDALFGKFCIGK